MVDTERYQCGVNDRYRGVSVHEDRNEGHSTTYGNQSRSLIYWGQHIYRFVSKCLSHMPYIFIRAPQNNMCALL